ncbi:leucyl aminopeptidase [Dasania sp. GY-MA-18]|uniref:Probable cytosol aminopeptidase n=1 Tax=Dasania phycosphaerae TaxID=2950436 RepID=A0A9J6RMZ4_9GAMM|nr:MULTISPECIES: leucyl aminopeptidase [Dasania]MCR8923290.1 leucyl aminopeptidase [Dasania sp. GY-MA-18]MCZ0865722.1 leucyl aminopeptidase [Dasania phycosphaerae]MCZ0869447.1 leucyl aminopeptidase [Dasania phycosphaerae]
MTVNFKTLAQPELHKTDCLIVPVLTGGKLSAAAKSVDQAGHNNLTQLLKRGDIAGKVGDSLLLPQVRGLKALRVLLLGCGDGKNISTADFKKITSTLLEQLNNAGIKSATLLSEGLSVAERSSEWMSEQIARAIVLSSYSYNATLSKKPAQPSFKTLTLAQKPSAKLKTAASTGTAVGLGMNVARELGNLPANICTPSYLAKQAKALARKHSSVKTSIIEEKKMRELGMGSLLSVTAGSSEPAKLIVMEYQGATKKQQPHVLVGKGITFDTGGISLKPGAKMDEMKYDMCGAASVLGAMTTLTELALPINVVAIIAAAENMPNGNATKPGDVVTSMSGQTIEILNTDAEGRLVLCDALTYAARFKPQSVIDIATLTGACVVALGSHATGLYSNQDDFADELIAAGESSGDRAWHMPLWDEYQPQLNSNFADIANIGGPEAGSVTAACFLSRFTKEYRWAHMDIAGTAWVSGPKKGATGRPVALLSQYLINKSLINKSSSK